MMNCSQCQLSRLIKILQVLTYCAILVLGSDAKLQQCDVETGQTNIILDIEESKAEHWEQQTSPLDLPIFGEPNKDIFLELGYPKIEPVFELEGKRLKLLKPLDRDKDNLSHLIFQVACTIASTNKTRNIPIIVRVSDINDNAPIFINTPYEVTIPESTPIGTTIFRNILAQDKDAGVNGLVEYFLVKTSHQDLDEFSNYSSINVADANKIFAINFPHQGQVTVAKALDYERVQRYYLTIVASDRARNSNERLSATTVMTVNIADSDDLDPTFIYRGCVSLDGACINPEYTATIPQGKSQGILNIHPERIQAVDLDKISASIKYSFLRGNPANFADFFEIDENTGIVNQKKLIDSSVTARQIEIIVQAEENTELKRATTAKLTINVKSVDLYPPTIHASAIEGFVREHSAVGTKVLDSEGSPIKFTTTDDDITNDDLLPEYSYELTTPYFIIREDGLLVVNDDNLDSDPPNISNLRFQVVARELKGNAASTPLSIIVYLLDINDNSPKISSIPPVEVAAGTDKRLIAKINATDIDMGDNSIVSYSIYHVSHNGAKKFSINSKTGEIFSEAKLVVGDHYSITIQASDIGKLYSRSVLEVTIIPGPNTNPPKFLRNIYDTSISESAELNSTVLELLAEDPESDQVHYTIISGNDLRQFKIGTESGRISIIRKLDREQITRYQLIVQADDNGGLTSTATVNIKVQDSNDNDPQFDENVLPFKFSVNEGKQNLFVGKVNAIDADEGINSKIIYSIPIDVPFIIDEKTGMIQTKEALDYETKKSYNFTITARDSATPPRFNNATIIVNVVDVPDEFPKFSKLEINVDVPENVPDMLITTVNALNAKIISKATYVILNGFAEFFKIDSLTGEIRTRDGLDYEKHKKLNLTIGTIENPGREIGDIQTVKINVLDVNDNPPTFLSIPEAVTVSDDLEIGSKIESLLATDNDGTSPANTIQYEIIGRGKATKLFSVDSLTGDVILKEKLSNELDTEYQVDVRAYDLGEPQLSSVSSLTIFVRRNNGNNSVENLLNQNKLNLDPESLGMAFDDDVYTITIRETTAVNTTLKILQIINSNKEVDNNERFKCEVISRNNDVFGINTKNQSCELILLKPLDFEDKPSHRIEIKLSSSNFFINPKKNATVVNVLIQNQNDNSPVFEIPQVSGGKNNTYYIVIDSNSEINTAVLQVKAKDLDIGIFGQVKYKISHDDSTIDKSNEAYFAISESTGIIRTLRKIDNLRNSSVKLMIEATDNNGVESNETKRSQVRVVINFISDINRMIFAFKGSSPKNLRRYSRAIQNLLEKRTGLMIFFEKFSNRLELLTGGGVLESPDSTDVWFYLVDPKTETILERNDSRVINQLFEGETQARLNFEASTITRSNAEGIFAPIDTKLNTILKSKAGVLLEEDIFPFVLITVSSIIIIIGILGIVYLFISWSRYEHFNKQQMRHYPSSSLNPPSYDPVIVNPQENDSSTLSSKRYETQVLGMSVNEEHDERRVNIDSKNFLVRLDKKNPHKSLSRSPTNSDASTVINGTLNQKNQINYLNNNFNSKQNFVNKTLEMNRNYANPLSIDTAMKERGTTTMTLGRLKSERNQIINGYDDTLSRNLTRSNGFSTLGRHQDNYNYNISHSSLNYDSEFDNNHCSNYNIPHHRFNAILPVTSSIYKRHQNFELGSSEANENIYYGSNMDYSNLEYNIDRSEQETTTEL